MSQERITAPGFAIDYFSLESAGTVIVHRTRIEDAIEQFYLARSADGEIPKVAITSIRKLIRPQEIIK